MKLDVDSLERETRISLHEKYNVLLSTKKFWNLGSHPNSSIRCAFYRFIKCCTLESGSNDVLVEHESFVVSHFIGKVFAEKSANTHSFMWDALLRVTKQYPHFWSRDTDIVFGKLYTFLKHACWGSSKISYPCMLPLICSLPLQTFDVEYGAFYNDFFQNFWAGRDKLDRSSSALFINSYFECIIYFLRQSNIEDRHLSTLFVEALPRPSLGLIQSDLGRLQDKDVAVAFSKCLLEVCSKGPEIISEITNRMDSLQERYLTAFNSFTSESGLNQEYIVILIESLVSAGKGSESIVFKEISQKFIQGCLAFLLSTKEIIPQRLELFSTILSIDGVDLPKDLVGNAVRKFQESIEFSENSSIRRSICYFLLSNHQHINCEEELQNLWNNLICWAHTKLSLAEKIGVFYDIIGIVKVRTNICVPVQIFDDFIQSVLREPEFWENQEFASIVGLFLGAPQDSSLLLESTYQDCVSNIVNTIRSCVDTCYVNLRLQKLVLPEYLLEKTLLALRYLDQIYQNMELVKVAQPFNASILHFLLIALCNPLKVSSFSRETSSKSLAESFELLKSQAFCCIDSLHLVCKKPGFDFSTMVHAFLEDWDKFIDDQTHCGNMADMIAIVIEFLEFLPNEYRHQLFLGLAKTTDFWATEKSAFFIPYPQNVALFCYQSFYFPKDFTTRVSYDREGLCSYSRRALLLLALSGDSVLQDFLKQNVWIVHQLIEFMIIAMQFRFSASGPFASEQKLHIDLFKAELDKLILKMITETEKQGMIPDFSNKTGFMSYTFQNYHGTLPVLAYAISTVASSDEFTAGINSEQLLQLYQKGNWTLLIEYLVFCFSSSRIDLYQHLYSIMRREALKTNRKAFIENSANIDHLLIFSQALFVTCDLESFETELTVTESCAEIFRWVRVQYDSLIGSGASAGVDFANLFDASSALILAVHIDLAQKNVESIPLNTSRFVTELCLYWFQQMRSADYTLKISPFLNNLIILWNVLKNAAQEDKETWFRVIDVEAEVNQILCEMFFQVGDKAAPDGHSTNMLRNHLSILVAGFEDSMIRTLLAKQDKVCQSDIDDLHAIHRQLPCSEANVYFHEINY
jgi:hypothetical protein